MESKFADIRVRNATTTLDTVLHTAVEKKTKITKIALLYKITPRNADGLFTFKIKFDLLSLFSSFNKHLLRLRIQLSFVQFGWSLLYPSLMEPGKTFISTFRLSSRESVMRLDILLNFI